MATLEEKQERVIQAIDTGFRGRLLARGQARSMIWREGVLPDDAPGFSTSLSYDLLSYGYALISDGLDILQENGNPEIARSAFEHGAGALESVIAKGEDNTSRDFHRFVCASAYHLARFSARAFSTLSSMLAEPNLSPSEACLSHLMLRNLQEAEAIIYTLKSEGVGSDDNLQESIAQINALDDQENSEEYSDSIIMSVMDDALTDCFMSALGKALLGFQIGDEALVLQARDLLNTGMGVAAELGMVPQWWSHRLAIFLLGDLWNTSFHACLPLVSPDAAEANWPKLRRLFIASLYKRSKAEIELWPSQLEAADRALKLADNMVVSLPTSAGKTRIAELCILACLASDRRVIFVTPLRALSAQTELSLEQTFTPLGKTVSSLYGSIGVNGVDENFLRERNIIVATPEKLDFALRNDPSLLNDVGLVVLDEGHMIGLGEREVRYEVQIQKLLNREDAELRRIVCLSAILPSGEKLSDFVGWLTNDLEDGLLQKNWRPTGLRFGEVVWGNGNGRLELMVGDERPYVPKYLSGFVPPIGRRKKIFPSDQRELCLATAWKLVEDGQSVLIFCPLRKSVEPFAEAIVDLHKRGALPSVLEADPEVLKTALAIGEEWFSKDDDLLACLKLGVAVHHGALPTPYRREVERLLRLGVLKVTISSPTLAQGLNLSATALIFHGLFRNRKLLDVSEFRNVIGRAGRAFVDMEGLVIYPMFDDVLKRRSHWQQLIADDGGKEMESGLLLLVQYLLARMLKKPEISDVDAFIEYVMNAQAWDFPRLDAESAEEEASEEVRWKNYIAMLDTAILGLVGEEEIADDQIEIHLDTILQSSLWQRRIERREDQVQQIFKTALTARTKFVWANSTSQQRRAYFLAGVGLNTGQMLDANSAALNAHLVNANAYLASQMFDECVGSIVNFAEIIFLVEPFVPSAFPEDWRDLLTGWLRGTTVTDLVDSADAETLNFIEEALIYKLPWGMEAVRVRGLANGDRVSDDFDLSDYDLSLAVAAVETGTLNISASVLMKAGFNSRTGAIIAVTEGEGSFDNIAGLKEWLLSENTQRLSESDQWPSPTTVEPWRAFLESFGSGKRQSWNEHISEIPVKWYKQIELHEGQPVRIVKEDDETSVYSAEFDKIGKITARLNDFDIGLIQAVVSHDIDHLNVKYLGPHRLVENAE